jgi:putative hydrolase of the HAD superfamily
MKNDFVTKLNPIKNVVFDLGGVLIAWKPDEIIAGVFDDTDLQALIKREIFQHPDWLEIDKGHLEETDAIQRFHVRTGIPLTKLEELLQFLKQTLTPIPESIELLEELAAQGVNLYILSNIPVCRFAHIQQVHKYWHHFKGIIISGEIKMLKPDREIFEHLLSEFNLQASETIFVDDMSINVEGAKEAGLHAVLFRDADDCRRRLQSIFDNRQIVSDSV